MSEHSGPSYVVAGTRTPIGRYGGALAPVRPDDLAAHTIRELLAGFGDIPGADIDEVVFGAANQSGEDNRNAGRMAALLAGLPDSVPGVAVNRLCASGLEAVAQAARTIRAGEADLVVAGGAESMSRAPFVLAKNAAPFGRDAQIHDTTIGWRFVNPLMAERYGTDSMPETAENIATEFGVSRDDQDAFAFRSQQRAAAAQESGRLAREITPVTVPARRGDSTVVDRDEHPRATSMEALAKLRPVVRADGTVTAGNASGVNDGAAALLVASDAACARYGLTPLARVVGAATVGVPPRVMGIGPVPATRKLLDRLGVALGDIDVIEINEAFAAQSLACLRELGLPDDAAHVNPNGGAIALGHPLGMTGARLALTASLELAARGGRYALVTLCVGVGQGMAMLLERVA
jgi:3-oxoadipyl-CoA thiolase